MYLMQHFTLISAEGWNRRVWYHYTTKFKKTQMKTWLEQKHVTKLSFYTLYHVPSYLPRFHNPKKEELFFSNFFSRPCKEGNSRVVSAVSKTMGRQGTDWKGGGIWAILGGSFDPEAPTNASNFSKLSTKNWTSWKQVQNTMLVMLNKFTSAATDG